MREELTPELAETIAEAFAKRDREHMQPTIDFFEKLLAEHPGNPYVLYEVGGSYDTAGQEKKAIEYYEQALPGLSGDTKRRCLLQYGSSLRNLERYDESMQVLQQACAEFPDSESLRVFVALTLHASGRSDQAMATLLRLVVDRLDTPEIKRYEPGLRGYADDLAGGAS
ncbi:tetratricopeptide repeat protein [Nocardia sp. XZ_19_385]|uniref:tetratricopeptide repeat protein n=1 Tax=Nocardia sp. XZ_19_385 TaxID=2769488 RepID=UPI0028159099|nr:tetratricopeptide repeat protein [Nocardia sp. XZ_19_385]